MLLRNAIDWIVRLLNRRNRNSDFEDSIAINMRDYLPNQKAALAEKLQEIHAGKKAAKLVFCPASVPTQQKYIQLTKDALSEYELIFPDVAQIDIPTIKKHLIVDDGPFTYWAEICRNEILSQDYWRG